MDLLLRYLAIGSAGFVGTVTRYGLTTLFGRMNMRFPLGTFVINITGSFILGWFATYALGKNMSDSLRLAIGVGFVGGYTTFSTYMYDSAKLLSEGAILLAIANLLGSLILGMIGVSAGIALAKWA